MKTSPAFWIKKYQLFSLFLLTYLITFAAGCGYVYLRPSESLHPWSLVWFFEVSGPTFSAVVITWICSGKPGILHLLSGLTRWKAGFFWYFAAAYLIPGPLAITLVYKALGNPSPGLKQGETLASLTGILVFTLFSGPIAEELGWRGFALPRLQSNFDALHSSLILGIIWCCWHLPLFFIAGSSQMGIPFPIYLMLVITVTIYMTWLYNNTGGSLIITILADFPYNLTEFLTRLLGLMPAMRFNRLAGSLLVVITTGIVIVYGPRYLSQKQVAVMPFERIPEPTSLLVI